MPTAIVYYTVFDDINISINNNHIQALPQKLCNEILLYKKQSDINRQTAGKYLLKKIIKQAGFNENILDNYNTDKMGKPFIQGFHPFNISHSGQVVACCMLTQKGNIGIDVEKIRDIEIEKFNKQFSSIEMAQILSSKNKKDTFFDYWTKKEAIMKAEGSGMRIPLHSIKLKEQYATIDGNNELWYLRSLALHPSVKATICTNVIFNEIILKKINPLQLFET